MKESIWRQGNRFPIFEVGDTGFISMPLGNAYAAKYHNALVVQVKVMEVTADDRSEVYQSFIVETMAGDTMHSFTNTAKHTALYDNWDYAARAGREAITKRVGELQLTQHRLLSIASEVEFK